MKKVHDVLAVVEFFINRFNSINDDEIGGEIDQLVVCYLRGVAPNAAALSPKVFVNNPLVVKSNKKGKKVGMVDEYAFLEECKSLTRGKAYDLSRMEDIYVGLNHVTPQADGQYQDLEKVYQNFWAKAGQWSNQTAAKKRCLPLGEVIDYLISKLQSLGQGGDSPFCYTI